MAARGGRVEPVLVVPGVVARREYGDRRRSLALRGERDLCRLRARGLRSRRRRGACPRVGGSSAGSSRTCYSSCGELPKECPAHTWLAPFI
ncbi:hypothetical protein AORI_2391 [Amycolatopsis keratiniphila]|uniref:Uncharacterized protein n=1 Tax=Amycolatopsis keratiniphila TaxID=129921 RepID=R4SN57_9PSEU|nr:hypothetical protein AORI_2391 [Amycolatopsis keratiniphila]